MNLYQISVPIFTNDGAKSYETQRATFEAFLLGYAGGFTRRSLALGFDHGEWVDREGKSRREPIVMYQVACQAHQFDAVVEEWFELFPDQMAVHTAKIGTAKVTYRPLSDI